MFIEKYILRTIGLMFLGVMIMACGTVLPSPTPSDIPPTLTPSQTIAPTLTATQTPVPATESMATTAPSIDSPTLPEATPIPLEYALSDLPLIEPDNASRLELLANLPGSLVFSPDMTSLVLVKEDGISVHEADGLGLIGFLPCEFCVFDYSPDGSLLAWNPEEGIVRIWEVASGTIVDELSGISDTCCSGITFSPDGRYLALAEWQQNSSVWDLENDREHLSLGMVQQVHFSPDGKTIAAESTDQLSVTLWDFEGKQEIQTLSGFMTAAPIYYVHFSPDWSLLLWGTSRVGVELMDMSTGQMGAEIEISMAEFSPDSKILAGTEEGWGPFECTAQLCLFDLPGGNLLAKLEHETETIINSLAFSPDGRLLASQSQDLVKIWDLAMRSELVAFEPQSEEGAWKVIFSPDGRMLAVHLRGGFTQLWGVAP